MKRIALLIAVVPLWAQAAPKVHGAMDEALAHYLAMARDLAADRGAGLAGHARALEAALARAEPVAKKWKDKKAPLLRGQIAEARRVLREGAADFASGDLERARGRFFALSKPLIRYAGHFRAPEGRYRTFYCPMKKAAWLQTDREGANPYYGAAMLRCGDRVRTRGEPGEPPAAAHPPPAAEPQPTTQPAHRH